jgi:hypothetical protein
VASVIPVANSSGSLAMFAVRSAEPHEADRIMSKLRPRRRLRRLRSMWGLRLRSLLRSLRNLASADCVSSGQVVSRDDVLQRFRGQRHRKSTN